SNNLSQIIKKARGQFEKRISDSKDPTSFFKYVTSNLSGPIKLPVLKNSHGLVISDNSVPTNIFSNSFSKIFSTVPPTPLPIVNPPSNDCASLTTIKPSDKIVLEKLLRLNITISPSADGICPEVLKHCATSLCSPLCLHMKLPVK